VLVLPAASYYSLDVLLVGITEITALKKEKKYKPSLNKENKEGAI
jgi:hypothetical protein